MNKKVILGFISFIIIIAMFSFWVKNRSYISTLKSITSEGITATNYNELPGLVKRLPGTKYILNPQNYYLLHGNSKVKKISRVKNKINVNLNFTDKEDDVEKRSAVITLNLEQEINMSNTILFASFQISDKIIGQGHQMSRMELEIYDVNGKAIHGPKIPILKDSKETHLILRPTLLEPIPLGSRSEEFDVSRVKKIAIRFILARYPDGISTLPINGKISFDGIYSVSDTNLITSFFKKPDTQRVAKDNINPRYELRKLFWKREKTDFFVGLNYPWNNYGWDIGKNPYGLPENSGWSANEEKLKNDFILFKKSGISLVRIYLFFDLRTGLEYRNGKFYGFDKYVWKDIESLIKIAGETDIKILPVLFDFGVADGRGKDKGVGEHPELLFSIEKQNFLVYSMMPLLRKMDEWNKKYNEPIFALELMNEPENMTMLLIPGYFESLKTWFQDLTNIIHNETSFKVTLGSSSVVDMQRWWNDLKVDIWQFHFYKYMIREHEKWPLNLKREEIKIPGIIFCGEIEPYNLTENLSKIKENGYNGVLVWSWNSTDGFTLRSTDKASEIFNWINTNKKMLK